MRKSFIAIFIFLCLSVVGLHSKVSSSTVSGHFEYVIGDGSISVYDMDTTGFPLMFTTSISTPKGVRGSVACAGSSILYISWGGDGGGPGNGGLLAYNLLKNTVLWSKSYSHGIDSHAITADCSRIYMPSGELTGNDTWYVLDRNGNEVGTITGSLASHPHNTIAFKGHVYLGGRQSTLFQAASSANDAVYFTSAHTKQTIRPFTVNAEETAAYITETSFLGFQQVNLKTGAIAFTVPVAGFSNNCTSNCPAAPSHGISISPDERWLYLLDSVNGYVHVFDISAGPGVHPVQKYNVKLNHTLLHNESPCAYDCLGTGWLHHSLDGHYVFVGDSGDVIDTGITSWYANPPRVVGYLPKMAQSRKEIEVDFVNGVVTETMNNRSSVGTGLK